MRLAGIVAPVCAEVVLRYLWSQPLLLEMGLDALNPFVVLIVEPAWEEALRFDGLARVAGGRCMGEANLRRELGVLLGRLSYEVLDRLKHALWGLVHK